MAYFRASDELFFVGIEIAHANEHHILRLNLRLEAEQVMQLFGAITHDSGKWHAVDVAGGRCIWRVHIAVRV
jgi:hypothetical protein